MRSLTIEVPDVTKPRTPETLQLIVSTTQDGEGDGIVNVTAHGMPEVMSLWSDAFGTRRAGGVVERRYRTEEGCERSILEEVGEGIASHIW